MVNSFRIDGCADRSWTKTWFNYCSTFDASASEWRRNRTEMGGEVNVELKSQWRHSQSRKEEFLCVFVVLLKSFDVKNTSFGRVIPILCHHSLTWYQIPDWELRSKAVKSVIGLTSKFSTKDCKKNQQLRVIGCFTSKLRPANFVVYWHTEAGNNSCFLDNPGVKSCLELPGFETWP